MDRDILEVKGEKLVILQKRTTKKNGNVIALERLKKLDEGDNKKFVLLLHFNGRTMKCKYRIYSTNINDLVYNFQIATSKSDDVWQAGYKVINNAV